VLPALFFALSGCGDALLTWQPDTYTVAQGDTLYSIAFRYGLDHQDLARWNDLGEAGLIYPGQQLRLTPPGGSAAPPARTAGTAPAPAVQTASKPRPALTPQPAPRWVWPVEGPVLVAFGERGGVGAGISIGGKRGDPVRAAAAGRVVYSGSGLIGYGKLIILKHNDTYLSAYGHNDALFVGEGDLVEAGQHIAAMGQGPGRRPVLHFEIRLDGNPVDPLEFLPRR
jgi:lipoprotein NlpD